MFKKRKDNKMKLLTRRVAHLEDENDTLRRKLFKYSLKYDLPNEHKPRRPMMKVKGKHGLSRM